MSHVRTLTVLAIVYLGTGCIQLGAPLGPREGEIADLPIEVALVEERGSQFEQEPDHPLLTVDFGTVVDDLSNMGGCWGTFTSREDSLVRADAEFYRFDLQLMEMTHQILQRGIPDEEAVGLFTGMNFDIFTEGVYSIESVVYFGLTPADLHTSRKSRTIALARGIAMYLARKHTDMSFPEIGRFMGNKNHSTVILASRRISKMLQAGTAVSWMTPEGCKEQDLGSIVEALEEPFTTPPAGDTTRADRPKQAVGSPSPAGDAPKKAVTETV